MCQSWGVMQNEMAGVEGDREEETFRHVYHLSNQTRTDIQTVQLRPEHIYFSLLKKNLTFILTLLSYKDQINNLKVNM